MCNCGCNTCKTTKQTLTLNENIAPREILSDGLKHHIDNNKPLTEQIYRAGSDSYFNLWAEARSLYSRGIIEVEEDDKEILTETDLGHFGLYETVNFEGEEYDIISKDGDWVYLRSIHDTQVGRKEIKVKEKDITINETKVPLDFPMLCEGERFNLKDLTFDQVKDSFPKFYQQPSNKDNDPSDEYYSYRDAITFPNPNDSQTSIPHRNMFNYWKNNTLERYGDVELEFDPDAVWFDRVKLIDDEFSKDKEQFNKSKQSFLDNERFKGRSGLDESLNERINRILESKKLPNGDIYLGQDDKGNHKIKSKDKITLYNNEDMVLIYGKGWGHKLNEAKKSNKKLNKPMRDSSGGKAYKVYVKDPKTKKIKTVRFGSGGLRAKINDKKARNAFAARHKCSQKKDKTKAGYWSCRLPRYAKLLGLKSSFSGFW